MSRAGTHLEQCTDAELGDTAPETKLLEEEEEKSWCEEQDVHLHGYSQAEWEAALLLWPPPWVPRQPLDQVQPPPWCRACSRAQHAMEGSPHLTPDPHLKKKHPQDQRSSRKRLMARKRTAMATGSLKSRRTKMEWMR